MRDLIGGENKLSVRNRVIEIAIRVVVSKDRKRPINFNRLVLFGIKEQHTRPKSAYSALTGLA